MTATEDNADEQLPDGRYVPWYRRCVPSRRTVVIALLLILATPFGIRWYRLSLLPDVPVPFDVESFTSLDLLAEDNAFTYFNQLPPVPQPACQWFLDYVNNSDEEFRKGRSITWADVPDDVQQMVIQARPKLDLYRAGGRCADASYIPAKYYNISTLLPVVQELRAAQRLLSLDVLRLADEEHARAAAEPLHDAFRASRHSGRRGCWIERLVGMSLHAAVVRDWHLWSRRSEVTANDLQAALDRLREDWKLTAPLSDQQKVEVIMLLNEAKPPQTYYRMQVDDWASGLLQRGLRLTRPGEAQSYIARVSATLPGWHSPILWVLGEPELSCRAAKLWLTQELRYCDVPVAEHPPRLPGPACVFDTSELTGGLSATTLNSRIRGTVAVEFLSNIKSTWEAQRREAVRQVLLETELQLQIAFRRSSDAAPSRAEAWLAEFDWPPDPFDRQQQSIRFRADDDCLVIWSVGPNGVDNDGKFENRPAEDDIIITIPWPTPITTDAE